MIQNIHYWQQTIEFPFSPQPVRILYNHSNPPSLKYPFKYLCQQDDGHHLKICRTVYNDSLRYDCILQDYYFAKIFSWLSSEPWNNLIFQSILSCIARVYFKIKSVFPWIDLHGETFGFQPWMWFYINLISFYHGKLLQWLLRQLHQWKAQVKKAFNQCPLQQAKSAQD